MNKKITFAFIILLVGMAPFAKAQKYIISTVAGNGTGHGGGGGSFSGDGGKATDAGLAEPYGVAIDDSGNLYIGDEINNRVRKVDKFGIITTVAGDDTPWILNDGKLATQAGLSEPLGVAVNKTGLYIADWNHRRIRKVDRNGIISTYAGTGTYGYKGDGGPASDAEISDPYGLALDRSGNLYIADAFNNVVRKVDTFGIITTFAGDSIKGHAGDGGQAIDAELNTPTGIDADTFGNVFIAGADYIRKVDKNGIITTWIGSGAGGHSGDGGLAVNAAIGDPFDVAADDSGNTYFVEYFTNYVRKVAPSNIIKSIAGHGVQAYNNYEGDPALADMWFPLGIKTDHSGDIFFADETNQIVRELSPCSSPVSLSPVSPKICRGVSVALTAKGYNTYSWSPGKSLKDSIGYTVIATPSVTTTYVVTGTTCTAHDTIVVTVDTTTKIPALKVIPNSTTLCNGQQVTLTASGATGYQWSPVLGLNSSTGSAVIATPSITTTYVVMEPTCLATDTAVVIVNPVPGIYVYPATTTSLCSGQTITLYEGGANDFIWSPMTGLDTTAFDSVNASPVVTTTYTVTGISLGCQSQPQTIVLTVQQTPVVGITPSSPGFCTGSFATIMGKGASSYLWGPSAGLSDTTGDTIIANPSITTTYIVTGTTAGCTSIPDTFMVAVDTMPVISVSPPSATICGGASATLIANGAPSYLWSPATGLNTTTGDSVIAAPLSTATYIITGINPGCSSLPDTVIVSVSTPPIQPTITKSVTGDTLISSAKNGNQWYLNDTIIKGADDSILIITGHLPGTYKVVVTNVANGCSSTSDSLVISGINPLAANTNQLSIYPNPTTGVVTISSVKNIDELKITNLLGQLLLKRSSHLGLIQVVDLTAFANGIYLVTITSGDITTTRKLLVSR